MSPAARTATTPRQRSRGSARAGYRPAQTPTRSRPWRRRVRCGLFRVGRRHRALDLAPALVPRRRGRDRVCRDRRARRCRNGRPDRGPRLRLRAPRRRPELRQVRRVDTGGRPLGGAEPELGLRSPGHSDGLRDCALRQRPALCLAERGFACPRLAFPERAELVAWRARQDPSRTTARGWSQIELAERAGLPRQLVGAV